MERGEATIAQDGQDVAPLDALIARAEAEAQASGRTVDEAAAEVVADLEDAASAINTRVAPLVPGCGFLVAVSGLLLKAEPSSERLAEVLIALSVILAVAAISFLAHGLFTYAGRRAIGLAPVTADIAFARERLVRKLRSVERGGWLAGVSLASLVLGILLGVSV